MRIVLIVSFTITYLIALFTNIFAKLFLRNKAIECICQAVCVFKMAASENSLLTDYVLWFTWMGIHILRTCADDNGISRTWNLETRNMGLFDGRVVLWPPSKCLLQHFPFVSVALPVMLPFNSLSGRYQCFQHLQITSAWNQTICSRMHNGYLLNVGYVRKKIILYFWHIICHIILYMS